MSYKPVRGYVPMKLQSVGRSVRAVPANAAVTREWALCRAPFRQGDEMACRCGKRWPIGEDHP